MAILARVKNEQYSYETIIAEINGRTIGNAIEAFNDFCERGIIINSAFDDGVWYITNEAEKCSIDFSVNELDYERNCRQRLGCSYSQYTVTMRVLITTLFGSEIRTLQKTAHSVRSLVDIVAGKREVQSFQERAGILVDFLDLLPGETLYRDELRDVFSDMAEYNKLSWVTNNKARELSTYQSYFRFFEQLDRFWEEAILEDKFFYFPVFLWWNLTSILPLRPSEFVLIPRDCLARDAGKPKLTIRRTKLKGQKFGTEYFIDKDYELCDYEITDYIADEIERYIDGTSEHYSSDIGTLFCSQYQYQYLDLVKSNNSNHYTYNNLRDCLRYFYTRILSGKKGLDIKKNEREFNHYELDDNEIEWITLGDTRHLSMINLIVSGGNPLICKELAGHEDINISANYYSNIKNFVEVLSFSRYRSNPPNYSVASFPSVFITPDMPVLLNGGRCRSAKVKSGDYSDCISTISLDGKMLHCKSCKFYVPSKNRPLTDLKSVLTDVDEREKDMHKSFNLMMYALERVRKGLGNQESLQSELLRYQASALQYGNAYAKRREMEEL